MCKNELAVSETATGTLRKKEVWSLLDDLEETRFSEHLPETVISIKPTSDCNLYQVELRTVPHKGNICSLFEFFNMLFDRFGLEEERFSFLPAKIAA